MRAAWIISVPECDHDPILAVDDESLVKMAVDEILKGMGETINNGLVHVCKIQIGEMPSEIVDLIHGVK